MVLKKLNKLLLIGGSVFVLIILFYIAQNLRDVELIIRNAGVAGPIVAILLFGIFSLTPIPAEPLALFCIYFFGPILGASITWVGGVVASLAEYNFGLHMRNITNLEKRIKKLPFGLNNMPVDSPYFLIFGRLIPGYGSKVISLVAGIHHVPLRRYLWTTTVTSMLGAFLLALGGYQIIHFFKP